MKEADKQGNLIQQKPNMQNWNDDLFLVYKIEQVAGDGERIAVGSRAVRALLGIVGRISSFV